MWREVIIHGRMHSTAAKTLLMTVRYHCPPCSIPAMSTAREKKFVTYSFPPQILYVFCFYCGLHYKVTSGKEDGAAKHK